LLNDQKFRFRLNLFLFFCITCVGLAADLGTKSWVFSEIYTPAEPYQEPRWWIDGIFGIQASTNAGALFGIGAGLHYFFATVSVLFLGFILVWLIAFQGALDRWLSLAMGLISAGILGNLYDRLGFGYSPEFPIGIKNHVRDWIYFRWEGIPILDPWPNFNIADTCLVIGAGLLFIHGVFMQSPSATPATTEDVGSDNE
jgi:signal peptidase II